MTQPIPVGAQGTFEMVVAAEHLANRFKDAALPPVLATPVMIMMMENAALNAIKPYLAPGTTALGTRVDIAHLAATPIGQRVRAQARVTGVEGRRIDFEVAAFDETGKIGEGSHARTTIDVEKFTRKLGTRPASPT